jgi:hypothetical protein
MQCWSALRCAVSVRQPAIAGAIHESFAATIGAAVAVIEQRFG